MRILIGLLEHMGDIVACEPVSRYLKAKHPRAHLTWAVSPAYSELIDTNPYIDQTLTLECLTDWIKLTKHSSYDQIVDLHVNYRICQHCGIPLIKDKGNPFVNAYEWLDYGTLLEAFALGAGLPALSAQPNLYLKPEHAKAADALALPDDFCAVHVESNQSSKDWKRDAWRKLLKWIRHELGLQIVEVGRGGITPLSPLGATTISLVDKLSILQTAEVIRRARFFIGVDSGPAHLANALQVPGIVLLGRHGFFRQYMPFNGFFASESPLVKMVRNLSGPVSALGVPEVMEAVRYVNAATVANSSRSASGLNTQDGLALAAAASGGVSQYYQEGGTRADSARSSGQHCHAQLTIAANGPGEIQNAVRVSQLGGHSIFGEKAASIIPRSDGSNSKYPRAFAFYLPQFHPTPENNWAYGQGFTEWHNIIKAQPQFRGHYQPRIPGELGFYDLRSPDILREQLDLAREYGISGFCFYYYYFQGKKLLYQPIRNYIESDLDAPFFFLWANENWSRRWDGGDDEVVIAQRHSREDDIAFIRDLLHVFEDTRYVKVEGKPLLLVYKPHLFPDVLSTTEIWRQEVEKHGFPGVYLVMVDDWSSDRCHPRERGFDASYEIPSNIVPEEVIVSSDLEELDLKQGFEGRIVDYAKFANFHLSRPFPEYKRFRTVMLPWDNTPRYGSRAIVHINSRGDAYKLWLNQALLDTYRRYAPDERIVFLHSWNEWCEGTYLEPDGRYGRVFLEQTGDAIRTVRQAIDLVGSTPESVAVMAEVLKVMQAKDEGAFRLMQAVGTRTASVWREVTKLQAERDAIFASRSWRITKPLRAIAALLRGQH